MADTTPTTAPPTPLPRVAKGSITPGNGSASRQETIRLALRLGSVVVLTASVLVYACLRSKDLSVAEILAIAAGGAALAGLATAGHRGGPGGGTTLLGGALLMITAVIGSGCVGTGPLVPDPRPDDGVVPCSVERQVVDGLDAAVDAVDDVLPDDAPKAADALAYARAGVAEGQAVVGACEALTREQGSGLSAWMPWIRVALDVVRGLMAILGAAHVDLPESLTDVLHMLGLAQAEPPPIERAAPWQVAEASP